MESASLKFIAFACAAALLFNLSDKPAWRTVSLLLSSIVFLALVTSGPLSLVPLFGFLLVGYLTIAVIQLGQTRLMGMGVCAIIFLFIWLKQYSFLPAEIFIKFPYLTLGLSFVFFRVLHLIIEAGGGGLPERIGPVAYLTYTLNFLTFVSGPIQRYDEFARDQFSASPLPLRAQEILAAMDRIVVGFFKVNVVALILKIIHADAVASLRQTAPLKGHVLDGSILLVSYSFFLYANFSGYMDIVVGLARLFRLRLPENFKRPFSATSFIDFWGNWHITLSTWLKTYVYNPLLMSAMRRFSSRWLQPFLDALALFATFFLVGLWHGRTSEFLFFGVLQGAGMAVNRLWQLLQPMALGRQRQKKLAANPLYLAISRGLTFTWFSFTLLWFWGSWVQIRVFYQELGISGIALSLLSILLLATCLLALWVWVRERAEGILLVGEPVFANPYVRVAICSALVVVSFIVIYLLRQSAPELTYKTF